MHANQLFHINIWLKGHDGIAPVSAEASAMDVDILHLSTFYGGTRYVEIQKGLSNDVSCMELHWQLQLESRMEENLG